MAVEDSTDGSEEGARVVGNGEPGVLTPTEVAGLARLSVKTVYRSIGRGELQALRFGNRYRITSEDYQHWIEGCRVIDHCSPGKLRSQSKSARVAEDGPGSPARLRAIEAGS